MGKKSNLLLKKYLTPGRKSQLILLAALFAACLVMFREYLFGNLVMVYNDVGGDTWQQYVMLYNSIVNHLREGTFSVWDFTNGFGTNLFNQNLFDPSLILLYILGVLLGPAHMLLFLVWIQVLRVLAAGLVFYWFVSCFSFSEQGKVLASFVYGLNGFLLVWGQHYQFGMAVIYLPLMLLCAEKFLRKEKGRGWLPVTVFLSGIYSVYFTYMSLICVGFYLLFRVLMEEGATGREKARKFLGGCGQILLGVGMSLAVFLPTANVIVNVSARLNAESMSLGEWLKQCFTLYPMKYYETVASRLFSTNLQNLQRLGGKEYLGFWNYYEDPVFFCSTLSVILNLQLLAVFWKTKAARRVKAVVYTAALMMVLTVALPFGGTVFNAFTIPTHRYTYVLMPILVLGLAWMWDYVKNGGRLNMIVLFIAFVFMNQAYKKGYTDSVFARYRTNAVILALTGEIMVLALAAMSLLKNAEMQRGLMLLLAAALVVNVVSEGGITYKDRVALRKEDTPVEEMGAAMEIYAKETSSKVKAEQAVGALKKPQDFFRELYRQDIQDALDYLKETDPEFYRVEKDYMSATLSMDSLAQGYRGISTYNSTMNGNLKDFVDTCYPELYYADTNRFTFWQNAQDNWFAAFTGIRYLLSRDDSLDWEGYRFVKKFGGICLYENVLDAQVGRFYTTALSQDSLKELCTSQTRQALLDGAIYLEDAPKLERVEDLDSLVTKECLRTQEESRVTLYAPQKDTQIQGEIQAAQDGYAMFLIPYEQGWSLTVDGEETELIKGDLGFLACAVEKGSHEIRLTFQAPYLKAGIGGSIGFWLLYGICILLGNRKRRQTGA